MLHLRMSKIVPKDVNVKHNWFRNLTEILEKYDCKHLLEYNPDENDVDKLIQTSLEIKKTISKIYDKVKETDILGMQNSKSIPHYKLIKSHCKTETFLNLNVDWSYIRTAVQLRAMYPRLTYKNKTYNLYSMDAIYGGNKSPFCSVCKERVNEDLFHVLFDCKQYYYIKKFISKI